jgi:hypothetical protein
MCVALTALVSAPSPPAQSTHVFSPAGDIIASGIRRQATRFSDSQETEREQEGLLVQLTQKWTRDKHMVQGAAALEVGENDDDYCRPLQDTIHWGLHLGLGTTSSLTAE